MSNSDVFGSPMILSGRSVVSPFGAVSDTRPRATARSTAYRWLSSLLQGLCQRSDVQRRIRRTVVELSKLENHLLRDIGLDRSAVVSAACEPVKPRRDRSRPFRR